MKANHPLRRANWIWPEGSYDMRNTYAQFRKDFQLPHVPRRAPFYITADQNYMLYVNGRFVGRGPARGYQATWAYDEFDLTPYLVKGHNWISVRAYNGGISNFQYRYEWHAGMLCAARWGKFELVSDATWPSRVSSAVKPDTKRVSRQMNLQEHVDARLDDQAWIHSARAPRGWPKTSMARLFGVMPWHSLEPRGLPNLAERMLTYEHTCTAATGRCASGYRDIDDAAYLLREEWPRSRWHTAPAGKVQRGAFALTLPVTGPDRYAAVSVDLGQLSVGTLIVEAEGAAGGEIVDLFFCEALEDDGRPVLVLKHVSNVSMTSRLRLRRGRTHFEFFHMMGHRYVVAIARDTRRTLRLKLSLRETIYPHAVRGRFECADPVLNDIHRISVRTQQVCSLDAYVDTPWREQAQWWGDARVQARNTFHISGDTRLLVRGVRCLARQEVPNGLTFGHAPTNSYGSILPDFSLIWALTIWDHYWQTGDISLAAEQWPRIERLLGYFVGEGRGRNGLLRYDERYWLFLDWTDIHKSGTPTLLNLWYVLTLEKLAALAGEAARAGVEGMAARQRELLKMWREQKR
ncbi:MAG: alpha-L-rhamnosidase, partial [Planctomycetes bacterium]|nr:alpha-L-rhamnosidase [Planctomycetota bacterium]